MSTAIEWTDETWNPVVGCTKVSQGCKNCYAKTLHDKRHKAALAGKAVHPQYLEPFETVQLMPDRLEQPMHWTLKARRVFVNSVSDLFHEDVPDDFLDRVFAIMTRAYWHTFQVLTKRPARMQEYMSAPGLVERVNRVVAEMEGWEFRDGQQTMRWPRQNVWLGVSVEDQKAADERIPLLIDTPAAVRFLSCEPLLGSIDFEWLTLRSDWQTPNALHLIDWVIVGGESGPKARVTDIADIRGIVKQCQDAGTAVFVKQLGRHPVEHTHGVTTWPEYELRDRKGGDPAEWPEDLRVREFPTEACAT